MAKQFIAKVFLGLMAAGNVSVEGLKVGTKTQQKDFLGGAGPTDNSCQAFDDNMCKETAKHQGRSGANDYKARTGAKMTQVSLGRKVQQGGAGALTDALLDRCCENNGSSASSCN